MGAGHIRRILELRRGVIMRCDRRDEDFLGIDALFTFALRLVAGHGAGGARI